MYRIDNKKIKRTSIIYIVCLLLDLIIVLSCVYIGDYIFILVPSVLLVLTLTKSIKYLKEILYLKELKENGKLIKNMPFFITESGFRMGPKMKSNPILPHLTVIYKTDDNKYLTLNSPIFFLQNEIKSESVDLLIDPHNPKRYYIDFNIENINEVKSWKDIFLKIIMIIMDLWGKY